jgi:ketosteroid isomerase-like protein
MERRADGAKHNSWSNNMNKLILAVVGALGSLLAVATFADGLTPEQLRQQVEDTERAFAQTMADRDHEAFKTFLVEETVFFSGNTPLRGSQQVADTWKPFFEGPDAPFSWEPELVVVLDSGTLALSSGPVIDPGGKRVATFNSVWRLESSGEWRIVFDKGSQDCPDPSN